jgi:hypothetical protein
LHGFRSQKVKVKVGTLAIEIAESFYGRSACPRSEHWNDSLKEAETISSVMFLGFLFIAQPAVSKAVAILHCERSVTVVEAP